eukprot:scaffold2913_cov181-Ochromonas_danica.AAC.30
MDNDEMKQPAAPAPNDYDRRTTFAERVARKSTFSREFTFDGAYVRDTITQPIAGLARTLTEVGNRFDPDAKFTKSVIAEYNVVSAKGNEGDIPFPDGFLNTFAFWKVMFFVMLVASIMGVIASGFMNFTDQVPRQWLGCNIDEETDCADFYHGHLYYLWITVGGGFVVGCIRWAFYYPENLPGLFKDVQTFHVDPKWVIFTLSISAISLGCGAALGPEQAMGNMGGGIAYFVTQHVTFADEEYKQLAVLAGMAAPLGALFPSPMLGALMMHELGEPPKHFMESTIILSIAACLCFAVYYELIGVSYLDFSGTNQILLSDEWIYKGYEDWQLGTGVVIGIMSAILCTTVMLFIGICKQVFFRVRERLAHNSFLREVVPPTLGGLCIGFTNWALPGTIGNGSVFLHYFIKYGASTADDAMSPKLLLCTGFARAFLLGVSMNCGFVGGIIFPFITMGIIAGAYMYKFYSWMPKLLCLATFMVSLPCGVVPLPFTFACLSVFVFFLGPYQTVPIFVSCFVSYSLLTGSGLLQSLVNRQNKSNKGKDGADPEVDEKAKAQAQKEADDFALQQYLGNKKATVPLPSPAKP